MAGHAYQSSLHGQGVQNSGSGDLIVGGDLNIGASKNNCLSDLYLTDPRHGKIRIEETKGGLLRDSYCWVSGHPMFVRWRNDRTSRLLWINGDPGKGKTMLLCGIIDELKEQTANATQLLSFFFCQATDERLNNAVAVLRGLIYHLVMQRPSLVSRIQDRYEHMGEALFKGVNPWFALREIFTNILRDPELPDTTLVIDALDECGTARSRLLALIVELSNLPKVKWAVSSRNQRDIEEQLTPATQKVRLCLELNELCISNAVRIYIRNRVDRLAEQKGYNDDLRDTVQNYLTSKADDTFLWVALVCQALEDPMLPTYFTRTKLQEFPKGLDPLYARMMDQIFGSYGLEYCKQILTVASVVYRPLTLQELMSFVKPPKDSSDDIEFIREMIKHCGSFLTVRNETVYFVHQSAKDYLLQNAANRGLVRYIEDEHRAIYRTSLEVMFQTLRRNIYGLEYWGLPPDEVTPPSPDPLAASRYSCIYWVDHLAECQRGSQAQYDDGFQDGGVIDRFLRRHYLHWLESLCILESVPQGILAMTKLKELLLGSTTQVSELVQDAYRFIRHNKLAIESSPLQVYASALLFSPSESIVRRLFRDEKPQWLALEPAVEVQWSACLATLAGHGGYVHSVAFSPDGSRLASGSEDCTVKVWDAITGACLETFRGHGYIVNSVACSTRGPASVRLI
ncbi:NACHT domain-containing protein [Hypoxylon crocopeplum]|nr:NACHT domain-containing protein [Hypoxylon crocopeplum]